MLRSFALALMGAALASADNFYLDFGDIVTVSSSYGGAAGTPGVWNGIPSFAVDNLLNTNGTATLSNVVVAADVMAGAGSCVPQSNLRDLVCDNLYSQGGNSWTVTISGLGFDTFDLYLYSPQNDQVPTGALTINNSLTFASFGPADDTALVAGVTYLNIPNVSTIDGSIKISGTSSGTPSGYAGLAGLQLIDTTPAPPPAVPEPSTWLLLGFGGLALRIRRKKP